MGRKKSSDLSNWLEKGIDIGSRRIAVMDEISDESLSDPLKALIAMSTSSAPINIYLHTQGGDVDVGLAFYDLIKACPGPVTVTVLGTAYSMGSIILQAASRRVMLPNASLMIHAGSASYGTEHVTNIRRAVKWADEVDEKLNKILLERIREKRPDFSTAALKELLAFDTYFDAKEALRWGLVDEIVGIL